MDQLNQYPSIIQQRLRTHAELMNRTATGEAHTIFDVDSNRYMLFRVGWRGEDRIHTPYLYLHIREGKIWIEEDWTEDGFATELLQANIPPQHIILGFRHPNLRSLSEFAVA